MIWRTLSIIQTITDLYNLNFNISELSHTFNLHSPSSGYFLFQIKPHCHQLVLHTNQIDFEWKGRFFFVFRDSLPNGDLIPSTWISKVNFAKLAPACQDTSNRIQKFLEIPEEERTFQYPVVPSGSPLPKTAMSGSQKSSIHFSLADIDADNLLEEKANEKSNKARVQAPRSSAKKRKLNDTTNQDKPLLEFDKAFDFFYHGMEHASICYFEKLKVIEVMDEIISVKNTAAQRDADEIARLKGEIENLKTVITKKSVETESRIIQEKEKLLANVKKEAAISALEARIMMATEASIPGFNASTWKSEIWKNKLAILKGHDPVVDACLSDSKDPS